MNSDDMNAREVVTKLVLGCDHDQYGSYECGQVSASTMFAISVGADKTSPSRQFKGDLAVPNEDGLLVVEHGSRVLMAVADGHFGAEASQEILAALAEDLGLIPRSTEELRRFLEGLGDRERRSYSAETTLLVAVFDRETRLGFGVSYGDSSLALVGSAGYRGADIAKEMKFVSFSEPESFAEVHSQQFEFTAEPGDLVLAFTDGVDECHYRHPETSVTPDLMQSLFEISGDDTEGYVRAVVELALAGVDGNPGGQDNIALVATRA